jgi:membrane protein YqaA with SNARE-associated domain
MQKTRENRSLGAVVAGPPVVVPAGRRQGAGPLLGVGATLALVIAAFAVMLWLTSDPARREIVESLVRSPFGLLVLFGLAAVSTATLILPAPGLALTAIAGAAGDRIVVGVVAGLGQAVGELTGYAAGWSGRSYLPENAATSRITGWMRRRGGLVIFVLAVVPNPLFDLAGVAAGALRMPVRGYLAAAATGKVIKNVAVAGGASMVGSLMAAIATN